MLLQQKGGGGGAGGGIGAGAGGGGGGGSVEAERKALEVRSRTGTPWDNMKRLKRDTAHHGTRCWGNILCSIMFYVYLCVSICRYFKDTCDTSLCWDMQGMIQDAFVEI